MTDPTPFPQSISTHSTNDPLTAAQLNTPLNELSQRTLSLNETITNALQGQILVHKGASINGSSIISGMAVYLDDSYIYQKGLADITLASDNVMYELDSSAYIVGVVQNKDASNLGNVVHFGPVNFTESELLAVLDESAISNGVLYLSGTTAGNLTYNQPEIGIVAGYVVGPTGADDGEDVYTVFINPGWENPFKNHIHFHVQLATTDDDTDGGWKAYDHADFSGETPPAGAVYGYDWANDTNLATLWPPIPIGQVHIDRDGVAADTLGDSATDIIANSDRLWWVDAVNDPSDYTRLDFYFSHMCFATKQSLVTSLQAADTSVTVTDLNGASATTGDLKIKANVSGILDDDVIADGESVKELAGSVFKVGPNVDGIRLTGSSYITASGSGTDYVDTDTYETGLVTLTVTNPNAAKDGPMHLVNLEDVQVYDDNGINYISMPSGSQNSMIVKFNLPQINMDDTADHTVELEFIFWASDAVSSDLSDLTISYNRIQNLDDGEISASAFSSSFGGATILNLSSVTGVTADYLFSKKMTLITTAKPGDVFFVKILNPDSQPQELRIMDMRWLISNITVP